MNDKKNKLTEKQVKKFVKVILDFNVLYELTDEDKMLFMNKFTLFLQKVDLDLIDVYLDYILDSDVDTEYLDQFVTYFKEYCRNVELVSSLHTFMKDNINVIDKIPENKKYKIYRNLQDDSNMDELRKRYINNIFLQMMMVTDPEGAKRLLNFSAST